MLAVLEAEEVPGLEIYGSNEDAIRALQSKLFSSWGGISIQDSCLQRFVLILLCTCVSLKM